MLFRFGKKAISAREAADLFIHDMAVIASNTFNEFYSNVIRSLRLASGNENAEYNLDKKIMQILYLLMITALNARAVNILFIETEKRSLISAIRDTLSETTIIEGDNSVILDIYTMYVDAIRDGMEDIETGNPLLPHDAVAGLFIDQMKLHQYEGVLTKMGEDHFIDPVFLMSISAPLMGTVGWWKSVNEKYKIK